MTEQVNVAYEVSSQGAERHWVVPYARLNDTTPTPSNPAMVTGRVAGKEVCGTILSIDAGESEAVIDFTCSMVYLLSVRNVLTYNVGAEATWGTINIGDPIYYDRNPGATMPAGTYLSTSPLDSAGNANPLFGWAMHSGRVTYPLGAATAATVDVAVMQSGAGGGA